jgi:hypothetical protein
MDDILLEYMTDAEKRLESYGEVTNPAFSDGNAFSDDGIMSPRIFGKKGEASCLCGKLHDEGAWCAECGTQAKEDPLGRMGHIELAAGWPEGFEALLCEVLDIQSDRESDGTWVPKEDKLLKVCTGESSVYINDKNVSGLLALEQACKDIDLQGVIDKMTARIDYYDGVLKGEGEPEDLDKTPLSIEKQILDLEGFLDCVKAMQVLDYTFADLFSHVLMVSPIENRQIIEIGIDPLGEKNKAYIAILQANNELKSALELNELHRDHLSEVETNWLKSSVANFVNVMQMSCKTLAEDLTGDKTRDKKSLGEELQKTRVDNSTFAVAEASKNLPIDAVAIPYNILLFMYKDEVYKNLLDKTEARIQSAVRDREILEQSLADLDEVLAEDIKNQIEECIKEEQQARKDLEWVKNESKSQMDKERFVGRTPLFETALLEVINAPSWQGDEVEVPGKVVMVGRFPVVSRNSIVALRPVMSENGHCITVNPAVCDRMGLDFDGDQLQVYRIKSPKAQEELWRNTSPLHQPFSATSGELLHTNDREDALGVWIATRMDTPEECNFQRDSVLSGFVGTVKDGVLETEGWVYSRHVLYSSGEGFVRTSPDNVVAPGDEIGRDKDGNIVKAPWFGVLREYEGSWKLLSVPQDRVHLPRGAKLNFDLGDNEGYKQLDGIQMPKGKILADWKVQEVESEDVMQLYKEGKTDANSAIYLKDADITTTAGRLMVAQLLTAPDEGIQEELLTQRIGKKQVKAFLGVLYENVFQREDLSLDEKAKIAMQRQESLQALGSQFAQFYSSYCDYDAMKYEPIRNAKGEIEKGKFQDSYYRFNSIKDQVESGAKGTQKNVNNFISFLMGLDRILDAQEMAEAVYKLDKAGQADRLDGITPVQRTGSIQRILSESMYNVVIEQEDCGTYRFESVRQDVASRINGRCLANEYVTANGTVYARGKLLNMTEAKDIEEDVRAHQEAQIEKSVDIRTVSGCTCNGSCSKCWGRSATTVELPKVGERVGLESVMALTSGITEQGNLKAIANSGTESAGAAKQFQNILNGLDAQGTDGYRNLTDIGFAQGVIYRELKDLVKNSQLSVRDSYLEILAKHEVALTYNTEEGRQKIGYGEYLRKHEMLEKMAESGQAWGFTVHLVPYMNRAKETDRGRFALGGKTAVRNMKEAGLRNKAKELEV